jgi:hypothetical protein
MTKDYVPKPDADFNNWQKPIYNYAVASLTGYVSADYMADWLQKKNRWEQNYAIVVSGDAKPSEFQAKKDARKALQAVLRDFVKRVINGAASPYITNAKRVELGLPIYKTTRTRRVIGDHFPMIEGNSVGRAHHIRFYRTDDVNKRGVIDAADGVELYFKIGEYSQVMDDYRFVDVSRRSPYIYVFLPEDAGKAIHWVARWYNTAGEKGPWSNFITLIVGNE